MERKAQFYCKKTLDLRKQVLEVGCVIRYNEKVVRIADVMFHLELVFYELIQRIQIDVCKQLRRQIPDWQADAAPRIFTLSLSLSLSLVPTAS